MTPSKIKLIRSKRIRMLMVGPVTNSARKVTGTTRSRRSSKVTVKD